MHTEAINHDPAVTFFQTGFQLAGRPSLGAWLAYGLGSENKDLPGVRRDGVAEPRGPGGQPLSDRLWGSGFLPTRYQGVKFRAGGDPVLYLSDPAGFERGAARAVHRRSREAESDASSRSSTIPRSPPASRSTRWRSRCRSSVPELTDLSKEPDRTFELYGEDARKPGTFAVELPAGAPTRRARRALHPALSSRLGPPQRPAAGDRRINARRTDQACAGLVQDLKQRGLLDDTLVVWGGEFGRTVYCQGKLTREKYGRDHHPRCFTMWMAGGGIKPGITIGETDDYSYNVDEGSGARARSPRHDPALPGHRPHEADLQVSGPPFPPDRCAR